MSDAAYSEVYDTLIDLISPNYPVYVVKFQYEGEVALIKPAVSLLLSEKISGRCRFYTMRKYMHYTYDYELIIPHIMIR